MKIAELTEGIRKLDFVLPEFQREYVWTRDQAKQLLVSLLRGYPTGSVLFWKTDNPPEIKNNAVARERIGTTSVILDGQQRLTTLYLFTQDAIPPYYRPEDIKEDPRGLHYDLNTGDLQYYTKQLMQGKPTWVSVTSCFDGTRIDVFKIANALASDTEDAFVLAQRYNDNLTSLRNVVLQDYPVQTVPSTATITAAIDVFDRVNSQGTKLSDAELALAHITGTWPQARRQMKWKIDDLRAKRFAFDLTFMVRSLVGVVRRRAMFETIHVATREELEAGWKELTRLLDYLVMILPRWASVHSTEDLNTTNVLVPAVVYLSVHDGRFDGERSLRQFIHWMYAASTWARYTSQTDQRLDHDVAVIVRTPSPWKDLVDAIIDQRGRIDVKPVDLEGRGPLHPLYRTTFVLTKRNRAVDWFNGLPLDTPKGSAYSIHSHHIFPQSLLYKNGYDPENHLHRQLVNEIANRAFLTGPTNLGIADRAPAEYLPEIEKQYPGALQKQFIPLDRSLWELDRYQEFLAHRRLLIAAAIDRQMQGLIEELEVSPEISVEDLVRAGEGPTVEFKSTARWDVVTDQLNKDLQKQIAKTIAAMLNSEGGTLLIGVADDGTPVGLDKDLSTLSRCDLDGYGQLVTSIVVDGVGPEFASLIHIDYPTYRETTICRVRTEASPKPAFVQAASGAEFYVRFGNTTRPLDPQATHDYISMHWQS